jgi:hypothetical protein
MYTIEKKESNTLVLDTNKQVVFCSPDEGYIIHNSLDGIEVDKVSALTNVQLLRALANAVKLK